MDPNGGKPLSPWKVPSRISLKRIRHKINSDLSLQTLPSSSDKNPQKANGKRSRLIMNKFALARSISTPTADENLTPNINTSEAEKNNDQQLLARLQQIMPPPPSQTFDKHFHSTMKSFSFDETFNNAESSKIADEIVSLFPMDWSLKSSCRFYSSTSSAFLTNFMKLRSTDESLALEYICSNTTSDNEKALFRSLTSYWTHPHIPWLRLFPRSQQQQQANVSFPPLEEQAQIALQDEWKIAFQSLFQAFRTKYSSFFYMCTHTFNILFREDSASQMIAIISPTTSGLRSTLEREGIEFAMADGGESLNNSANKNNDEGGEDDDDENGEENDVTCAQWLEDMGLSASSSTNTNNERRTLTSKKKISNEKNRSTTILIRDVSSVNSLFNFLLNKSQRTCMSLTGPLTGIPPTLLSPRPFLHSTLKYLNVHFQSNSIVTIDGGPLLPDRMKGLWNLLTEKNQDVQMICTNVERTSALSLDGEQGRTIKQISLNANRDLGVQFATV